MNRPARPFRRTVLKVAGFHLALLLGLGAPFSTCQKPKKIQPVEIVDLGSLRPGPGTPAPPVATSPPLTPPTPSPSPTPPETTPQPTAETPPTPPEPQKEPSPEPTPTPKPEPQVQPKTIPKPVPKHEVKVSAVKTKASGATAETKTAPKGPPTPNAADIKSRLKSSVPGQIPGSGGDGAGMEGRPDGLADDFSWYRALIKQTVQAQWKKPPLPSGEKILTEVSIRIAQDGSVTFLSLSRPSGDAAMDASVEAAVRATARIPRPLPPGLGSPDYTVIIQFKLE